MNSHLFVRPATGLDAAPIAQIQARTMAATLRASVGNLSDEVAAMLTPAAFATSWNQAITAPPSPDHHVLVAVEEGIIVGFGALVPTALRMEQEADTCTQEWEYPSHTASDASLTVAEISALDVAPRYHRAGHGSRLLAALTDLAREGGATTIQAWILSGDESRTRFFDSAGFAPSTLRRTLAIGEAEAVEYHWHAHL